MSVPDLNLSIAPPGTPDVDATMPTEDPFAGWDDPAVAPLAGGAGLDVVAESQVRSLLELAGNGANGFLGDPDVPDHWRFEPAELDAIVPPLTRAVNRSPRLVAAVEKSDTAVLVATLAGYGWRNVNDGIRAQRLRAHAEEETPHHAGEREADPFEGPAGAPADGVADLAGGAAAGAHPAVPGAVPVFPGGPGAR